MTIFYRTDLKYFAVIYKLTSNLDWDDIPCIGMPGIDMCFELETGKNMYLLFYIYY